MKIDRQLIQKYNKPVPRYTSYPPANFFGDLDTDVYLPLVEKSNAQNPNNISIYIHIPFCKRLCHYCGCNSCPMAKSDEVAAYIAAVKKEIQIVLPLLDKKRKISQIHYGGGTPNAIDFSYLHELNQLFFDNFKFIENAEVAIECHPAYLDENYVAGLKKAGFNRFSLGLQDFNRDVLKAVNRTPSKLPVDELVNFIRHDKTTTVNFDFIYGLPLQTKNSFLQTIEKAIEIGPDRLVTFSYAHVPWVNSNQKKLEAFGLPEASSKIDMTEGAFNLLEANGYRSIGMDHYVLKKDELFQAQQNGFLHRNFQGYCTRTTTGQVYAFGVSGISQLNQVFAQNTKSIPEYIASVNAGSIPIVKGYQLSDNENITGSFIAQLMCNKKIDWNVFAESEGIHKNDLKNFIIIDEQQLKAFEQDQIITRQANEIQITENGLPFIRNVVASFDPKMRHSNKTFSKAV